MSTLVSMNLMRYFNEGFRLLKSPILGMRTGIGYKIIIKLIVMHLNRRHDAQLGPRLTIFCNYLVVVVVLTPVMARSRFSVLRILRVCSRARSPREAIFVYSDPKNGSPGFTRSGGLRQRPPTGPSGSSLPLCTPAFGYRVFRFVRFVQYF